MLELLEGIEAKQRGVERPQRAAQAAREEARKTAETAGPGPGTAAVEGRMKEEMHTIIGGLSPTKPNFKEIKMKRPNAPKTVLPNLQISDQIQELERIITALRENVLDKEQMKIVKLELAGLKDYINKLRKEIEKEGKSLNELDQSLWAIRDQRLEEAIILSKSGA